MEIVQRFTMEKFIFVGGYILLILFALGWWAATECSNKRRCWRALVELDKQIKQQETRIERVTSSHLMDSAMIRMSDPNHPILPLPMTDVPLPSLYSLREEVSEEMLQDELLCLNETANKVSESHQSAALRFASSLSLLLSLMIGFVPFMKAISRH